MLRMKEFEFWSDTPVPETAERYRIEITVALTDIEHIIRHVACSADLLGSTVAEVLRDAADQIDKEI